MNQEKLDKGSQLPALDRAAILLLSMGEENAASVIRKLGRREVQAISERMAKISNVTQHDVAGTLSEFFDCYRNESGVNGASRVYLERALDKAVGRKLAKTMLDDIYGGAMNDDLRRLEWIPPELIVRFLEQEHVQMQALFLAFLPPEQASAIIVLFPESKHDDLLYRIASLREVSEHVIDDVRLTLESCIEFVGRQVGAQVNGVDKAVEIMNRYNGNKSQIIELMKKHNTNVADEIQEKMYDFDSLIKQTDETLTLLLNDIPDELWTMSLKGVNSDFLARVLGALPKRLAQVYQQQIDGLSAQPLSKVIAARKEIMSIVRDMSKQGDIEYRLFEEETAG
ncbi:MULTISPECIES: FliG C-terminal domain-containing protein [unclassified Pseudoalteromonas]|uniref:FliG C-terminal domain-containing protein n=1 Tax=unclassified Pseudoalteromonas TaxID=194690 RepID=UPI0001EF91B8|nr:MULTISPECIES: FliG C-terminal domain-containing protein [unclassified Pseudoalteromonas]PHQ95672.1 MAG: flagellar motor switch protein FliG [Pseudoalteromonas sp.]ADT67866.1 FliGL [Pseudoalteromonas sp. SM9913]MDN3394783.1 FliG C-terminal domain-containing protein [Pseudoalteromonas sp. APC 3215]MDN3402904.1 FliG C-terminal domain-containing protein [Pseudoalteromonas sp. APC 3213]MDN3430788.1 FliG C-terminal domain-containing protein [Pseudoalteromonas sp. APC 3907]